MKLVYSRQAIADLQEIAAYYTQQAGPQIAEAVGNRLRAVAVRIAGAPYSAPQLSRRSQIRMASVVRYPFRIFYRVHEDAVEIVHFRHTARRSPRFGDKR